METQFLACVRLRACYRAGLIKSQNALARKKSQNSNALWVQKLSGCTIYKRVSRVAVNTYVPIFRSLQTCNGEYTNETLIACGVDIN